MVSSSINPRKKSGRPSVDSEQVNLRMQRDLLDALDQFIKEEHPGAGRPEALRLAFRDWAVGHGYISPSPRESQDN